MQNSRFRREGGFSLVELSVATAIYSMGLGSLSLMMLLAVQGTTEARFDTTAAVQLSSLAEMILMTSDAAGHYAFSPASGVTACDLGNACSAEEMAVWQLATWRGRLAAELPGGSGLVCRDRTADDGNSDDPDCDGEGGDVIKIFWQPQANHHDPDSTPNRQVLRLP
jgi:type IV pilus modification protein PilV